MESHQKPLLGFGHFCRGSPKSPEQILREQTGFLTSQISAKELYQNKKSIEESVEEIQEILKITSEHQDYQTA